MESIELYHISDTHLGRRQYKSDIRKKDFGRAFDQVIQDAIDNQVDAVIHTGDLFDSPNPGTTAISQVMKPLRRLDDHNIPFLGIVGNHERKMKEQWLNIFSELENIHRLGTDAYEITTEDTNIGIYGVDAIRKPRWDSKEFKLQNPEKYENTLLCMHELFVELVPPTKADYEIQSVLDRLNFVPNAIALGDYHAPAETEIDGTQVFYAGATERTSPSDNKPSYRKLEVTDEITTTVIPVSGSDGEPIPRPFKNIELDLTDNMSMGDVRKYIEEIPKEEREVSVVRVVLNGSNTASIGIQDCYTILGSYDIPVKYVHDNREKYIADTESVNEVISNPTDDNIEDLLDDEINDISENIQNIELYVRDSSTPKSELRDKVDEVINGDKQ